MPLGSGRKARNLQGRGAVPGQMADRRVARLCHATDERGSSTVPPGLTVQRSTIECAALLPSKLRLQLGGSRQALDRSRRPASLLSDLGLLLLDELTRW